MKNSNQIQEFLDEGLLTIENGHYVIHNRHGFQFTIYNQKNLPTSREELLDYFPRKYQNTYTNITARQYFEYVILPKLSHKQVIEEALQLGLIKDIICQERFYFICEDIKGREILFRLGREPKTIDGYKNIKPIATKQWLEKFNLTPEEFFIDYMVPLDKQQEFRKALKEDQVRLKQKGNCQIIFEVKDCLHGYFWGIDLWFSEYSDIYNFIPQKYIPNSPISREQFYIDYYLLQREDYSIIKRGLDEGILEVELTPQNIPIMKIKSSLTGEFFNLRMRNFYTYEDLVNYNPKQFKKSFGLSQEEYYYKYTLPQDERFPVFEQAVKEKIITFVAKDDFRTYFRIKCCDTGNYKDVLLRHIPKDANIKWFRDFKEYYYRLTPEEIAKKIEGLSDSPTRDEYFRLKAKVKNWKNGTEEDLKRLEEIAIELGIDIEIHKGFIMKYNEAKEIMNGEVKLEVFKEPIVLTEENLEEMILGHSIVWDLYDVDEEKSIYVGECRSGQYEFEALKLYVEKDKVGTIERRFREYGYGEDQPIIERIFERNFTVRLLAVGEDEECKFVRAYESVYNEECNDGEGCLEKQG